MAVFLINVCKFNGCGLTFPSLGDLIQHIEFTHIGKLDLVYFLSMKLNFVKKNLVGNIVYRATCSCT